MVERDGPGSTGRAEAKHHPKGLGLLTLAVVASYLGAEVLRDAAKKLAVTGTGAQPARRLGVDSTGPDEATAATDVRSPVLAPPR
jgi:hypothetical protein